jgi:multiple sugar transport system ATP-binding protein
MGAIRLSGLTKAFRNGPTAVDDVTLEIADGEFMVLVGPSGCGKSTLLRLIAGIEEPTAGTIEMGERDVTRLEPRKRDIAMVFQNYARPTSTTTASPSAAIASRCLPTRRCAGCAGA